jgi:two-component system, chemotaxis family, CheB/CheR fusion protein
MAKNGYDAGEPESCGGQTTLAPVVVGIGASAGGVQALQSLFAALPNDTGGAFVVVVHLDPQSPSEMANILATRTGMPVKQVDKPERLKADHVYVIPPDRRLSITNHEIAASEFAEPRGHRSPIDLFFRSLAEQHGDGCAVVLTGAGTDGAVGIRAVKEAGGIILVQDPSEAEYPSMPRNAIATGVADFVLPLKGIAEQLADLVKDREGLSAADVVNFSEDALRRILAHVRIRTGHDFTNYKRATVVRRIARRMQVTRTDDPAEYYNYLKDNTDEASALLTDLLISVTTFFRDSEAFEALKTEVIPQLFPNKQQGEPIRVWVAGCATGEEAYSISMLLLEEASRHEIRPAIQIFGSDLDARALAIAREGRFPAAIEADVSEERLKRFFLREGDEYRVRQEVRDTVLFASHSVLKDPPFSRVDLVSCRNLLIYLDRELQQQVCGTFHYALNAEGFLLLGSSETADNPPGLFRNVDRKARIYQSTVQNGDKPRLLPRLLGNIGLARDQGVHLRGIVPPSSILSEAALHRKAIERVAPPSILVDSTHRVIHLSETAGRYLQPSGGPLSGDIVDLVRPELRFELRSALHRVFEKPEPSLSLPILVRFNGARHRVLLQVKPAFEENDDVRHAVVLFIEGEAAETTQLEDSQDLDRLVTTNDVVRRLNEELQLTQARLRTTREESEVTNEELRAANEELQSINEEYRSTSEELETSKEELQSINEELQTVNSELKLKLEAVSRAHSDLQNLMAATDFGTLFLDSSLRIKRFTQQVTELFSVTPSDEGRPITDFAHQLEYDDLVKDAQTVLSHLAPLKHEARSRSGRWYDIRLRPYRTVDDKIDGVVITFVDITELLHVEKALQESKTLAQQEKRLIDLSRDPIFIWDYDGGILEWNRGCEELYGYSSQEALGKTKEELLGTTVPHSSFSNLRKELLEKGSWNGELHQKTRSGRAIIVESRIVLETIEGKRLALECTRDITERTAWETRQQMLLGELTHRVKNTLTVVQSIAHQTLRSARSGDEFVEQFDGRLSALASAHGLLVESNWRGADLSALIRHQLQPYIGDEKRLAINGEPLSLPADLATPFGLVFHELATNAAKHGSLSSPNGKIRIHWTLDSGNKPPTLTVVWRELDGPRPSAPERTGFGTALIKGGIPNATVTREFLPEGLFCTITVRIPMEVESRGVEV